MEWFEEAKRLFEIDRPKHFTDYRHCYECEDFDKSLNAIDIDSASLNEFGHEFNDPLNFVTAEGFYYFFPALVKLAVETIETDIYFHQLQNHLLEHKGFFEICGVEQKLFVNKLVSHCAMLLSDWIDQDISEKVLTKWKVT